MPRLPFFLLAILLMGTALEREVPDQPPGSPAREDGLARSPAMRVSLGSYTSVQVNVDGDGQNILGDAANEPSIAVNPLDPSNMVVGWRQFDTVASNFREAGWAYTLDGGQSWTFPGVLEEGVFRSDPSLDADSQGRFFYQSLRGNLRADVFRSTDGGVTWSPAVPEFGGDKNWLAVDRSGTASDGFLYGIWQRFGGACCGANVFTRSVDGGASFQAPVPVALSPTFGTLAVGPAAEVYATGIDGTFTQDLSTYVVAKSTSAGNPAATPTFTGVQVDLGGTMLVGTGPNPVGLLGQPNVFVARSGEVYVLGSVAPSSLDPMDVTIIRSPDGARWSTPVRVNDDAMGAWQWMAAASVAPNGRIDAVWNDTRDSGLQHLARLYYAYSWDGGATWSANVPVSPTFDTSVGYPNQAKMGDYSTIVSGDVAADAAYTATFNGEQDVYHVRVFPDCNENGVSDVTDLAQGGSLDCDANHVPDECQAAPVCLGAGAVPGGLTVERGAGGDLTLRWDPACGPVSDYAVHEGMLGTFTSHAPRACTTGGDTRHVLAPGEGSTYYLIVPVHAGREGSYGADGAGSPRPPASGACFPQHVQPCPSP